MNHATKFVCREWFRQPTSRCIANNHTVHAPPRTHCKSDDRFWVASIVRGQAYRVAFWVSWHLQMGASRILLYDNGLNYGLHLIDNERVTVVSMPGAHTQTKAYDDAIARARARRSDIFVGCWDIDEYLYPMNRSCVSQMIDRCAATQCAGIRLNTIVTTAAHRLARYESPFSLTRYTASHTTTVVKTIVRAWLHGTWRTPHAIFPRSGCVHDERSECPKIPNMPFDRRHGSVDAFSIVHFHCTTPFDWIVKKSTTGRIDFNKRNPCPTCNGTMSAILNEYASVCVNSSVFALPQMKAVETAALRALS